VVFQKPVSDRD